MFLFHVKTSQKKSVTGQFFQQQFLVIRWGLPGAYIGDLRVDHAAWQTYSRLPIGDFLKFYFITIGYLLIA